MIGITGNIAAGKSAVVAMLRELGAEAIDGDAVVHKLMGPASPFGDVIRAEFGPDAVNQDGSINRPVLGQIVFSDPEKLARLESIVHPPVVAEMRAAIHRPGPPVLVLDAVKLIESGLVNDVDVVWVVDAGRETRIERLMARNGISRAEAERRVDAQPPQAKRLAMADVVIDNEGDLKDTRRQVFEAFNELTDSTR